MSLYFLNYLVLGYFFLYTIMPHAGAVLINPALTKLSVIHALPKEENLNILSQNIYHKILQKEKNIFLCSSQIEKNSIRSPKNKAFNRKLHKDAIPTLFLHQTETNIGKSTSMPGLGRISGLRGFFHETFRLDLLKIVI